MLTVPERDSAVAELDEARERREPIGPLTARHPDLDLEDAYAVQHAWVARRCAAGAAVRGYKVGLASVAMQRMAGVDEPDYGHLLDAELHADGAVLDGLLQPRVEVELAFVLARELRGPDVTPADVLAATERVVPAIEIADSRIADWRMRVTDSIADNASCGAAVLGRHGRRPGEVDTSALGAILWVDGHERQTGTTGAVLGDPARSVAWLANRLFVRGVVLAPGDVVLPGSCIAMEPVSAGVALRARIDGVGEVSCSLPAAG